MDIGKLMQQAQRMQSDLKKVQKDLAKRTYHGSAGNGVVQVVSGGDGELKSVKISPDFLKECSASKLEGYILAAVRDASAQIKKDAKVEFDKLSGGLGLPPGLGF